MGSATPSSLPLPLLAADEDHLRVVEVLGVLGVVVWAAALIALMVSDVLHARSGHRHHQAGGPGRGSGPTRH